LLEIISDESRGSSNDRKSAIDKFGGGSWAQWKDLCGISKDASFADVT
jgi:hypothetical protein